MRKRLIVGTVCSVLALASCGPFRGATASHSIRRPVAIRGEPSCPYRIMGRITGRSSGQIDNQDTVMRQARSMGANAIIDFRATPEFDASGRPTGTTWEALAVSFSDPGNGTCYR